jgi:signal transduction histidine kinase
VVSELESGWFGPTDRALKIIIDASPVGIMVFNERGRVAYANHPAESLFNKTVAVADNLKCGDFVGCINRHDSPRGCGHGEACLGCPFFNAIEQTLSGDLEAETRQGEACLKRDGDLNDLWVKYTVQGIVLNGHRAAVMAIEDITLHKRAEAQSHQIQKAESLQRMAGAVAHHYNNMLAAVMGNLELTFENIAGNGRLSPASKVNLLRNLKEAMNAARRASEISDLMLAYLGQTNGTHALFDLSEVCRQCVQDLKAGFPETFTFNVELPSPGPAVNGNVDQIKQVIRGVVTNAREALDDCQGKVSFKIFTVPGSKISEDQCFPLEFKPQAIKYACIEVVDNGCGISGVDVQRIFDPFFSTKFIGRGLGLSVVLGAVKAHGGCVTVEGGPGLGSVFRVYLPQSEEVVPEVTPQDEDAGTPLKGISVLLVEDELLVRRAAAAMLTLLEIKVIEAKNGSEAVETFLRHGDEIKCVLCDLVMPDMDGWETLEALRRLSPGIPVILTSGYDEALAMQGEHPEKPQGFLGKPYRITELQDLLIKAINK